MATAAKPGGGGVGTSLNASITADGVSLFGPFRPGQYLKSLRTTLSNAAGQTTISACLTDDGSIDEAGVESSGQRFFKDLLLTTQVVAGGLSVDIALEKEITQDSGRYLAVHNDITNTVIVTMAVFFGSKPCACKEAPGESSKPLATEIPGQGGTRRRRSTGLDRRQAVRGGPDIVTEVR